ncbi:methyltransferase-like protein 24 isoform X3 [Oreochromis aureus]|uniref:methyltransferase-like protein 24 isoform X3 n=1 Tax=Oreochromis aureus TaxID=47969 RepID=UPI001953BFAE|nr:methyltransferase-like protein 24 isoform X3 [Oreochromis aureus]
MRTCAPWRGRCGVSLRSGVLLLLIPPFLLALQLLVVGSLLPGVARVWMGLEERDGGVAFSVISIEPKRSSPHRGTPSRRPGVAEEAEMDDGQRRGEGARAYEDENEMHARQVRKEVGPRALEVQLWAAGEPSFTAELNRIISYITRPQMNCSKVLSPGRAQPAQSPAAPAHWLLCAEDWLLPATHKTCVAYSFSLASNHGDGGVVSQHKMWLEWRAPKKRAHKRRGNPGGVSQTLADIMAALGHHTVHFLYADLLSGEWRVFQNWIEAGTLQNVHHLVAKVHLQWAGFEVAGRDEEVLRYWFSVLQGLQACGLKLVHSSAGEGHSVLKQTVANAHSSYTLSWVNTRH